MRRWRDDPRDRDWRDDRGPRDRDRGRDRDRDRGGPPPPPLPRGPPPPRGGRYDWRDRDRDSDRDRDRAYYGSRDRDRNRDRDREHRMPPPPAGPPPPPRPRSYSVESREFTKDFTRDLTPVDDRRFRQRSVTVEAPMLDPNAKQDTILCQACAKEDATVVCYDCSPDGATYCESCMKTLHEDESMRGHWNKGPLLRCKRGDCTGKYAAWWCSICYDVCTSCAQTRCSLHRDKDAVLIKASVKNATVAEAAEEPDRRVKKYEDSSSSDVSSSESSSDSDSDSGSDRKKRRRKRRREDDELVPTWGRAKQQADYPGELAGYKGEGIKGGKGKGFRPMDPPGLLPNPLRGTKIDSTNGFVGLPPPPKQYPCDYCNDIIGLYRYRCTECLEPRPYDLCHQCFNHVTHKHDTFLLIVGFSLSILPLPSSQRRGVKGGDRRGKGRASSPEAGRDISPCMKFWEGKCSDPCPWGRPHVKQDRPDHCCYICGGTGHFAKECTQRKRLESGDAEEVKRHSDIIDQFDDGVGIGTVLAFAAKPILTDEERLRKGIVSLAQLKERIGQLRRLRKKKKLRKAGVDVSEDGEKQADLLKGLDKLKPEEPRDPSKRQPTPEIDVVQDDVYCARIGAPPPRNVDELQRFNIKELYDAARERPKGAPVPETDDEAEWDQDFYDSFERSLGGLNKPLCTTIDDFVRREIVPNRSRHMEIMCAIESRLQKATLTALQNLTTWYMLDAVMKQAGGHFIKDVQPNLGALVETFLTSVMHQKWRTRCRDMLRSWRDIFPRREVDEMLEKTR